MVSEEGNRLGGFRRQERAHEAKLLERAAADVSLARQLNDIVAQSLMMARPAPSEEAASHPGAPIASGKRGKGIHQNYKRSRLHARTLFGKGGDRQLQDRRGAGQRQRAQAKGTARPITAVRWQGSLLQVFCPNPAAGARVGLARKRLEMACGCKGLQVLVRPPPKLPLAPALERQAPQAPPQLPSRLRQMAERMGCSESAAAAKRLADTIESVAGSVAGDGEGLSRKL